MSRKHKKKHKYYSSYPNQFQKPQPKDDFDLRLWRKILILLSFFAYLILFLPFLKNQVLAGHDAGAHLSYLRIFTDALSQGQFPVRWIEWVVPGQNQPLFSFYQPLLYYLGSIPHFFGLDILNSLYITVLGLWLFSGLIVFLFVKNVTKNSLAGAAAACLYIFAPYHILDVFVRAAYPESIALAFAPGMFWAIERYFTTEKRIYIAFLAIFTAATFLSHPPTLLMFGIPVFFYIFFLAFEKLKAEFNLKLLLKKLGLVFFGFILAGGLSSFFALPALLQQNLTKASSLNAGYLDFHNHFVCLLQLFWSNWGYGASQAGCNDQLSFQLGIINWIILLTIVSILAFYLYKKASHRFNREALFWLVVAFFGMYMTLSYSQPFWEGTPYLPFLQFPWRFLSVAIFSAAVLSGILFTYLKKESYKFVLFIILIIVTPLLSYQYLEPAAYLDKGYFAQDFPDFYKGTAKGQQNGTAEIGYMPKNMQVLYEQSKVPLSEIGVTDPNSNIKILSSSMTVKDFVLTSDKPQQIEFFIHYFPGWEFTVNGKSVKPDYSNIYDFPFISAPAGKNRIVAKFVNTPFITFSNYISLTSLFFLIGFVIFSVKWKKREIEKDTQMEEI